MADVSIFTKLNGIDVSSKVKTKNGLTYLTWSSAVAEVKKLYPDMEIKIYPQVMDQFGNTRFWHDDGKTGWVEVGVTINGKEEREVLAIMDFKNKAIPADSITSTDANKAMKRCMVKAIALHGLGLYVYYGDDLPEDVTKAAQLQTEILDLMKKKIGAASDKEAVKKKIADYAKSAEKEADPTLDEELIIGDPRNISDPDILTKLKKQILAIRASK